MTRPNALRICAGIGVAVLLTVVTASIVLAATRGVSTVSLSAAHKHHTAKVAHRPAQASTDAALASKIWAAANAAAKLNGDFTPTNVRYVATTRQAAVGLDYGATVDTNEPVYMVEFDGPVTLNTVPTPPGAPVQTGTGMYLVLDQSTMTLTDAGVVQDGNSQPDLSKLGTVVNVPTPAGSP